jgi:hypothetical protein
MCADDLMDDFPPAPGRLVTLSNWRKAPFSAWGFRNVRRLIPTANIAASGDAPGLDMSLKEIGHIGFTGHEGHPTTLKQALRAHPHRRIRRAGAGGWRPSGTTTAWTPPLRTSSSP